MAGISFVCASCGGTFEESWNERQARAEAEIHFGAWTADMAKVCDDCYAKLVPWVHPPTAAERDGIQLLMGLLSFIPIKQNPGCLCGGRFEYEYYTYYRCGECGAWWRAW